MWFILLFIVLVTPIQAMMITNDAGGVATSGGITISDKPGSYTQVGGMGGVNITYYPPSQDEWSQDLHQGEVDILLACQQGEPWIPMKQILAGLQNFGIFHKPPLQQYMCRILDSSVVPAAAAGQTTTTVAPTI
jgi:hypothetical protein